MQDEQFKWWEDGLGQIDVSADCRGIADGDDGDLFSALWRQGRWRR